jgi:conjugal transfer pilus assembly protein TraW
MRTFVLVLAGLCASLPAVAEHLGAIGPTYPIQETDFLDLIQSRLRGKERSGELARLQDQARDRAVKSVQNPKPVAGVKRTEIARTFYYDPSFVLDHNILDADGRVLFPAGTRKNPLEVVGMSTHLVFFDARDSAQVARAKALIDQYGGRVKPILVGGSYLDLMQRWKRPVFYDQDGALVRKLGIGHVPALVSQEGLRLRVDEIVL